MEKRLRAGVLQDIERPTGGFAEESHGITSGRILAS
jgi:hypothetical protein